MIAKSNVPAPGVYDIKSLIVEGPRFTFRPKPRLKESDPVPGPGNYNPNPLIGKEKAPVWGITKNEKSNDTNKDKSLPGPGAYLSVSTLTGPKWGFGSAKRGASNENRSPGPGAYEIKPLIGDTPTYVQVAK